VSGRLHGAQDMGGQTLPLRIGPERDLCETLPAPIVLRGNDNAPEHATERLVEETSLILWLSRSEIVKWEFKQKTPATMPGSRKELARTCSFRLARVG
jgi:hypothetical protein